MMVAVVRLELSIPHANSLKEKRRALSSIIERLKARYNVSVAEVGEQEQWQRAIVGVALVAGDGGHAREQADRVVGFVQSHLEGEVCRAEIEIL